MSQRVRSEVVTITPFRIPPVPDCRLAQAYIRQFVRSAAIGGFEPVVFNSRGCADSPVTSPKFYSASYTGDIRFVVNELRARFPNRKMYAAGWSLGANILVNYLAEEGDGCTLASAASIGNPFDLVLCSQNLERPGLYRLYDSKLAANLRRIFNRHVALFRGMDKSNSGLDVELATRARTVREFDEAITAPSFGHRDADAYYRSAGSAQVIHKVRTQLLCVQASDDPISLLEAIPTEAIGANDRCALIVTDGGGHIGWACGGTGGSLLGMESQLIDRIVLDFWKQDDHNSVHGPPAAAIDSSGHTV